MKDNFDAALVIELKFEGGKVDDPQDPGGRTCQGITQAVYAAWCRNNGKTAGDVWGIADADRDAIYRLQYADKIKFDALPAGLDLVMLDGAINSGPTQAVKWLQRALGAAYGGKIDGSMGEATFAAVKACDDLAGLIGRTLDRRLAFLKALKTFRRFGKGWTNRVEQVRKIATTWAAGVSLAPTITVLEHAAAKATVTDAKKIPSASPGAGTAGIGAATASATGVIGQIKAQLAQIGFVPHVADVMLYLDHASALMLTGGGIAGVVGGAYFAYARWRAGKLHDALDTLPAAAAPAAKPAAVAA